MDGESSVKRPARFAGLQGGALKLEVLRREFKLHLQIVRHRSIRAILKVPITVTKVAIITVLSAIKAGGKLEIAQRDIQQIFFVVVIDLSLMECNTVNGQVKNAGMTGAGRFMAWQVSRAGLVHRDTTHWMINRQIL